MCKTPKIHDIGQIVNISDILEKFGKYQILQYAYICFPIFLVSIINVNYIFVAGDVRYRCRITECDSSNSTYTVPWWPNHIDQCTKPIINKIYNDIVICSNSSFIGTAEKCADWIYENHDTIVSELNLACQPWKKNMVGTVHSIGMAFAMPMGGWMADIFGRKSTLLICALGCFIGNFKTFVSNYSLYISIEFLEAAISGGVYTAAAVLMLEIAGNKNRVLAGVIFSYATYMGEAVFALIAMAVPYWKTLIYIIYSPSIMSFFLIILGKESPRWLIVKGKVSQAKEHLKEMAKMNKIKVDEEELKNVDEEKLKVLFNLGGSVKKQGLLQSFQCKELVIRFVVASFGRFTVSFVYYGLLVNSVLLPGNKYTNFLLAAVMSFPGELICMFLMNKIGRKLTLMIGFLLCSITCIASGYASKIWLRILLFLLAKLVTSACYTGIVTYTVELFPTSIRGSLIGLCTFSSAFGNMLAPLNTRTGAATSSPIASVVANIFMKWFERTFLFNYSLRPRSWWQYATNVFEVVHKDQSPEIASQLFGATAVIASGLLFFTPETKDLPLLDTIEQVADSIEENKKKKHNNREYNSNIYDDQTRVNV